MPSLLINAVSCKAGGGVNDLVHTLPLLEEGLSRAGWDLHTWTVEPAWQALQDSGYAMDRVTLVDAKSPLRRANWEFIRFPRVVRQRKPDVVFQFSNFIFRDLKVPQVTVLRSPTFFSEQYAARRRTGWYQAFRYPAGCHFSAATIRRASQVLCISETHRQDILRTVGPCAEKVRVSHLGFTCPDEAKQLIGQDQERVLAQLPKTPRALLAPLRSANRRIVLNVAHYYEHKNLGDLLEAILLLREKHPDIALVTTAGLTEYHGPRNARTVHDTRLATELAEQGVLFDLGPVPKEWVWPLLALADLFVFPSSLESFGHPLLEAMSMDVPVVAADTPIHREIAGHAAVFHRVGDSNDLAVTISGVLDGTLQMSELIQAGRDRASNFSWSRHVADIESAILAASGGDAAQIDRTNGALSEIDAKRGMGGQS